MATEIKLRRDISTNWTSTNPILAQGEPGYETDTGKLKLGDGTTAWASLAYQAAANIVDGTIVNADINASAAIVDTKLATIATAGKVSNSATTATDANTASAIVARNASGNFTAGTITAAVTGAASSNVLKAGDTMTGALVHPLGAAATPSLTFTGDLDTGVFSPGADQVAVATNGAGRLFVDGNGLVDVVTSTTTGSLRLTNATADTTNKLGRIIGRPYTNADGDFLALDIRGLSGANEIIYGGNSASLKSATLHTFFTAADTTALGFERLRITSAGLIGLGTSAPGGLLELSSDASGTLAGEVLLQRIRSNTAVNTGFVDVKSRRHTAGSDWTGLGFRLQHQVDGILMGFLEFNSLVGGQDVAIGTGGSTRLLVNSSGNVGINTQSPQQLLHVNSSGSNGGQLQITNASTGAASTDGLLVGYNTSNDVIFNNQEATLTKFFTSGLERAAIDSSGRLLVGTSSARNNFFNTTAAAQFQIEGTSVDSFASLIRNSANPNCAVHILAKSRGAAVGSNTIVQSADQLGQISFQGSDGTEFVEGALITAEVDGTPGANDMPGRIVLSTTAVGASSPTERMRIASNGSILFVATSESSITSGAANGKFINFFAEMYSSRATTGAASHILFYNPNGYVGQISTTASATSYTTSSDYRLKENVTPLIGAIDRLQQIPVHRFNFKVEPNAVVDGFIAHEAQEVVPECVTGTKDEVDDDGNPVYQGIDQSKLVPLLTAALQEAIAKIEVLEQRLNDAGIN
jgi:hypothetical protein